MEFLKNPTTVKMLAAQIIKACDNYIAFKIPEKQLKDLITYYTDYTRSCFSVGLFLHALISNMDSYPQLMFVVILFSMFTAASASATLLYYGTYGSLIF
jgi:uncharacterized protein (TIGR04540 family)